MLHERVAAKGLALTTEVTALTHRLRGDPTRFTQALLNLAGNAVKFTDTGEVAVRVACLQEKDGRVLVRAEVQESGIGVAPDVLGACSHPSSRASIPPAASTAAPAWAWSSPAAWPG